MDSNSKIKPLWIAIGCVLIVIMWFFLGILLPQFIVGDNIGERGQFGDMFGAVNSLFSGFALIGVVFAIILQQRELRSQHKEFVKQTESQQKLLRAQLLRDRFQMYWTMYKPTTKEDFADFEFYVDDYMGRERYEHDYKGKRERIAWYIFMSQLYEYLAFTHSLKRLGLKDPLGDEWVDLWIRDNIKRKEFLDVHEEYGEYYPVFAKHVEEIKMATKS